LDDRPAAAAKPTRTAADAARAVRYWAKLAEAFCNQDVNPRPLVDRNPENADFRLMTPICKPETPQNAARVFCLWNSWETAPSAEAAPLARARLALSALPSSSWY